MHVCVQNISLIKNKVREIIQKKQLKINAKIIVVTKTFSMEKINPLIEIGHLHFGENKIQEAENKWDGPKKNFKNLKLHMVGKLQSNKVKKAIKMFDYILKIDGVLKKEEKISQMNNILILNVVSEINQSLIKNKDKLLF